MMDEKYIKMHLAAGRYYGKASTCLGKKGKGKIPFPTEEAAIRAAGHLNLLKEKDGNFVEPYPCYWCSERFPDQKDDFVSYTWHIGRRMDVTEILLFLKRGDEILEMEDIQLNVAEPVFGAQVGVQTLRVHSRKLCEGQFCCIHNPSDHHMKTWPMNWRGDRRIMERICPHGIGHIDPDDAAFRKQRDGDEYDTGVHGCDGCCVVPS